jgi:hypothetical protein
VRALVVMLALAGCSPEARDLLTEIDTRVTVDAGGADLQSSLCSIAGVALCDGFESDLLGFPPWVAVEHAAQVSIDRTRAYRGVHALRVHTNELPDVDVARRHGEITERVAIPGPLVAMRFFVYVPSPAPTADWRLSGMLQADIPYLGPMIYIRNQSPIFATPGQTERISTRKLPTDRWVCVEWRITRGAAGDSKLFVDEQEVTDISFAGNTELDAPIGLLTFGMSFFGNDMIQPAYDIWIDEVMVDGAPIGCAR